MSGRDSSAGGDELVGRTLCGYRIIRRIGAGGMGVVYEAEQLSLSRRVALRSYCKTLDSGGPDASP